MTPLRSDVPGPDDVNLAALETEIESLASTPAGQAVDGRADPVVHTLLELLENGVLRAAAKDASGAWHAVPWVKRGILLGFRIGKLIQMDRSGSFAFVDKDTFPTRYFTPDDGVRIVPGGSTVRRGAHLGRGVVCMPPMYVNVGAWVGGGTMIDSHALVGSCAQIGERCHISAAAQIGGVLEPVNAAPVIVEDDVMVGGNCGVYEGTVVREGAVLGAGVILTRGTPVFDLARQAVYRGDRERPLEIPAGAVVVPGARGIRGGWGAEQGLALQTPVIVKYRDDRTETAIALEQWLR